MEKRERQGEKERERTILMEGLFFYMTPQGVQSKWNP